MIDEINAVKEESRRLRKLFIDELENMRVALDATNQTRGAISDTSKRKVYNDAMIRSCRFIRNLNSNNI
jgi:hypothetical protein